MKPTTVSDQKSLQWFSWRKKLETQRCVNEAVADRLAARQSPVVWEDKNRSCPIIVHISRLILCKATSARWREFSAKRLLFGADGESEASGFYVELRVHVSPHASSCPLTTVQKNQAENNLTEPADVRQREPCVRLEKGKKTMIRCRWLDKELLPYSDPVSLQLRLKRRDLNFVRRVQFKINQHL